MRGSFIHHPAPGSGGQGGGDDQPQKESSSRWTCLRARPGRALECLRCVCRCRHLSPPRVVPLQGDRDRKRTFAALLLVALLRLLESGIRLQQLSIFAASSASVSTFIEMVRVMDSSVTSRTGDACAGMPSKSLEGAEYRWSIGDGPGASTRAVVSAVFSCMMAIAVDVLPSTRDRLTSGKVSTTTSAIWVSRAETRRSGGRPRPRTRPCRRPAAAAAAPHQRAVRGTAGHRT